VFFFQAEDGIRDYKVTGVQTCALPISSCWAPFLEWEPRLMPRANAAQQDGYPARVVSRRDQQSRRPGACALVYSRTVQNERAIGRQRACRRTPLGGLDRGEWQ